MASFRDLKSGMRHEEIKWVEEHNIHVTLKFFGETAERKINTITGVLRECAGNAVPVVLKLSGLGIFGSSYAPKVIWVGIEPFKEVADLMKTVHSSLAVAGFEADRQNLVPHLTLGRIKFLHDKVLFRHILEQHKTIASEPVHIGEIILYESILRREGPEYIVLDRFPLKKEFP